MEQPPTPPPISGATITTSTGTNPTFTIPTHLFNSHHDSLVSSPPPRITNSTDESPPPPPTPSSLLPPSSATTKLRIMCSYGGHIVPLPHDKSLCYVGGDTRILVVDRQSTLLDLLSRFSKLLLNGKPFTLKYQLPNEDLDSLITVSTDEDLENMIDEYDRILLPPANSATRPSRLRLFLFPAKPETTTSSLGSILDGSVKSEEWFLNALNGTTGIALRKGFSAPTSVNSLLGLEENLEGSSNSDPDFKDGDGKSGNLGSKGNNLDIHSTPDSPAVETTSSFGSTSSSPALVNFPPIWVHVEDGGGGGGIGGGFGVSNQRIGGIEGPFSQSSVGVGLQLKQDEGFVMMPSPLNAAESAVTAGLPTEAEVAGGEPLNRVLSDYERSDQVLPVGHRKPSAPQNDQLLMISSQSQQKLIASDLPSPDSVSRDSSLSSAISHQKPMIYKESGGQVPSLGSRVVLNSDDAKVVNVAEPSMGVQMQQKLDSGYVLSSQYDLLQQQQLQQPRQLIHPSPHYVGVVPMPAYYPLYASQHRQFHNPTGQYPMYYVPAGQAQAYGLPLQQPDFADSMNAVPASCPQVQTTSNATVISASGVYNATRDLPSQNADMSAGVHKMADGAAPPLVQVASAQHLPQQQFVGYSQTHHPSQFVTPTTGATGSYVYEFADPAHYNIYFTQPVQPPLAAQYQTTTSTPAMVSTDNSAQLPTNKVK